MQITYNVRNYLSVWLEIIQLDLHADKNQRINKLYPYFEYFLLLFPLNIMRFIV